MNVTIARLTGGDIFRRLPDLATLRITVFADFPYLYAGTPEYEMEYLREFADAPGSVLIAAMDGERVVGAATASPMALQKDEFRDPFERHGYDTARLFYFGESVLLPEYRGQGIGHAFFDQRESAAREAGASHAAFAAVVRPEDHPARPRNYSPLDGFWRKRGYVKVPNLTTELAWKEWGEEEETGKIMQYWMCSLGS
ncbi:GNAT superfamily N-acetyltransferase [Altererythrobacter atlanticus]|uniref:Acetyltransferase (GNAT) family protein n=1 Tax=Croceibacterium atlanticum TaxID=1267766 RepID=A0A0F7KNK6_9SPHN|nr:GNAT family N-acetyltransferase [Croceibacterium atlanticum]AKH42098.1 Acetyltransferase (GNAT) family protein [Croceibacterium atlanticum]MBB5733332.1 GNAT superfamily N-acetyltransferase [Croceibacterium atlanticum]